MRKDVVIPSEAFLDLRRPTPRATVLMEFDLRTKVVKTESGCLVWQGKCKKGKAPNHLYGVIFFKGEDGRRHNVTAPRAALALAGRIPFKGRQWQACHECDNPGCVNLEHLFAGTALINNQDMVSKGRGRMRRFTDEQVRSIRGDERIYRLIAEEYGCSISTVCKIKTRRRKALVSDDGVI